MSNKELLEREIGQELVKLGSLEPGSKEHSEGTDAICKLIKMGIELNKGELERDKFKEEMKLEREKFDEELKLKREKFDEDVKLSDRHEANDEVYHEHAEELELKKLSDNRKKLIAEIALGIAGVGLNIAGICTYRHLFKKTLIFEETGSITSSAGRNLINSMKMLFRKN